MAIKDVLKTHRTWEDGVGLLFGLTIVAIDRDFPDGYRSPEIDMLPLPCRIARGEGVHRNPEARWGLLDREACL